MSLDQTPRTARLAIEQKDRVCQRRQTTFESLWFHLIQPAESEVTLPWRIGRLCLVQEAPMRQPCCHRLRKQGQEQEWKLR
jgi:hypothetical protein